MSVITSYTFVTCRFIVELLQFLPLVSISTNLFKCTSWITCGLLYISFPFTSLATISTTVAIAVKAVLFAIFFVWAIVLFGTTLTVRKRDINATKLKWTTSFLPLFFTVYFQDVLSLALRGFFCHFHGDSSRHEYIDCGTTTALIQIVLAALICVCFLPCAILDTLMSSTFDFKRLSGRITSVRVDIWTKLFKIYLVISTIVVHNVEGDHYSDDYNLRYDFRTAFTLITTIFLFSLTIFQVLQAPHTRPFDNRLRAASLGIAMGVAGMTFVDSVMGLASDDDTGLQHRNLLQAVCGAIVGALCAGAANYRIKAFGRYMQRDINALTGNFDADYAECLIQILNTTSNEDLDALCGITPSTAICQNNAAAAVTVKSALLSGQQTQGALALNNKVAAASSLKQILPPPSNHSPNNRNSLNVNENNNNNNNNGHYRLNSVNSVHNNVYSFSPNNNTHQQQPVPNMPYILQNQYQQNPVADHERSSSESVVFHTQQQYTRGAVSGDLLLEIPARNTQHSAQQQNSNNSITAPVNGRLTSVLSGNSNTFNGGRHNTRLNSLNAHRSPNNNSILPLSPSPRFTSVNTNSNQDNLNDDVSPSVILHQQLAIPHNASPSYRTGGSQQDSNRSAAPSAANHNILASNPMREAAMLNAKERLDAYMISQNFSQIHRSLNFDADVEILLRDIHEEWEELAQPQREIARMAILQVFAALYLKSLRGEDGSCPPSYFLWFSATALTLWQETDIANIGIRVAAECTNMALDTAFLCFLIQKMCEDIRNSSLTAKRTSGVSDMAAFRRWTSSARGLHEKALVSLRRFFKTSAQASHWNLINCEESDRHLRSTEIKTIRDLRTSLNDALSSLNAADNAYSTLLERYPSVPEVSTMVLSFRRQFFRDAELTPTTTGNRSEQKLLNVVGNNNMNTNMNSKADGVSTGQNGKERDDDESTVGSQSVTSVGSALADTPKQVKLGLITDAVSRAFNRARMWSFLSLFVVITIGTILLIVALLELRKVNEWIDVLIVIGNIFNVIPESCLMTVRPISGTQYMEQSFFDPVQTYIETNDLSTVLKSRGESSTSKDVTLDATMCDDLLSALPSTRMCIVAYTDGTGTFRVIDLTAGTISELPGVNTGAHLDFSADEAPGYRWWTDTIAYAENGTITSSMSYVFNNNYVPDLNGDLYYKYTAVPIFYAPYGSTGTVASDPPVQGVFAVVGYPDDNDKYVYEYTNKLSDVVLSMQTSSNELETSIRRLKIDNVIDATSGDFFSTYVYGAGPNSAYEVRTLTDFTFSSGVSFLSGAISNMQTSLVTNWQTEAVLESVDRYNMMEFCTSSNVVKSDQILTLFQDHLSATVKSSQIVIAVCACVAVIAAAAGALLTTRLIRNFLKEFDRSDSVTPALAMISMFPKVELKKISKAIGHLRVDRGIFDPDDEHAGFMDLTVSRNKQKYQDALLKARQIANERDRELNQAMGIFPDVEDDPAIVINRRLNFAPSQVQQQEQQNFSNVTNGHLIHANASVLSDIPSVADVNADDSGPELLFTNDGDISNDDASQTSITDDYVGMDVDPVIPPFNNSNREMMTNGDLKGSNVTNNKNNSALKVRILPVATQNESNYAITNPKKSSASKHSSVSNKKGSMKMLSAASSFSGLPAVSSAPSSSLGPVSEFGRQKLYNGDNGDITVIEDENDHELIASSRYMVPNSPTSGKDGLKLTPPPTSPSTTTAKKSSFNSKYKESQNTPPTSVPHVSVEKNAEPRGITFRPVTSSIQAIPSELPQYDHHNDHDNRSTSTAARSALNGSRKLVNALCRRPISRSFFLIWFVVMVYVAVTLILCVISVGNYQSHYDNIGDLMMSSFHFSVVSLFAAFIRRGNTVAFASTPFSTFGDTIIDHYSSGRSSFFDVIDRTEGKSTVGRYDDFRTNLLYTPNCLSSYTSDDCTTNRDWYKIYSRMTTMQQGLVRAVIQWTDYAADFERMYNDATIVIIPASDPDTWFLYDSLKYDLELGMKALRTDIADTATEQVSADTIMEIFFLGGGILLGLFSGIAMELIIRENLRVFRDTVLLLKVLPSRLLDDYKVMQRVLSVRTDDENEL